MFLVSDMNAQYSKRGSDQKDLKDVLHDWFGLNLSDTSKKKDLGKIETSILPGISYSTSTGFLIGFAVSMSRFAGDPKTTAMSTAVLSANYTSKNQFNTKFKSDIFLADNKWYLEGDWRFSITSQSTFGVGTEKPKENEETVFFDLFRFYEKVSRNVVGNLYLGVGLFMDRFSGINSKDENDNVVYPNYHDEYNKLYSYDTTEYNNTGLALVADFDTRDNLFNPYKGVYFNMKYISNQKVLGGNAVSQEFDIEGRTYLSFGKVNKHVFATWLYGKFVFSGFPAYLNLPAIGWDKYEKSGRGYTAGRYRGKELVYGEFEYRFPITSNGLLGGVAFVNLTSASNPVSGEKLFDYVRPAYGGGLRFKFDKKTRTNICIDFGKGSDGSTSFVLNLAEAF
jgi:hypothetical protein